MGVCGHRCSVWTGGGGACSLQGATGASASSNCLVSSWYVSSLFERYWCFVLWGFVRLICQMLLLSGFDEVRNFESSVLFVRLVETVAGLSCYSLPYLKLICCLKRSRKWLVWLFVFLPNKNFKCKFQWWRRCVYCDCLTLKTKQFFRLTSWRKNKYNSDKHDIKIKTWCCMDSWSPHVCKKAIKTPNFTLTVKTAALRGNYTTYTHWLSVCRKG